MNLTVGMIGREAVRLLVQCRATPSGAVPLQSRKQIGADLLVYPEGLSESLDSFSEQQLSPVMAALAKEIPADVVFVDLLLPALGTVVAFLERPAPGIVLGAVMERFNGVAVRTVLNKMEMWSDVDEKDRKLYLRLDVLIDPSFDVLIDPR